MCYNYWNEYFYNTFPGIQNAENLLTSIPLTNIIFKNDSFGETAGIVTPNFDTLYGIAIFDFSKTDEIELQVPEIKDRYYSMQFMDIWCKNTAYIGTRTNNGQANIYILTNKKTNTNNTNNIIFIPGVLTLCLVRVYANYYDQQDIVIAASLINQINILNQTPSPNNLVPKTLVQSKLTPIDAKYYIDRVNLLNKLKPLDFLKKEKPKCYTYNTIGNSFSQSQAVIQTQFNVPKSGWLPISASVATPFAFAVVQWQGLYANDKIESLYYFNKFDLLGNVYNGINNYIITFPELPPVKGFWSITCYNSAGFIVENEYNRYTVGTSTNPVKTEIGYIIYLQNTRPSEETNPDNNWLPIPKEPCYFIIRTYLPIDTEYLPPQIINKN